jgi:hypothetical protein
LITSIIGGDVKHANLVQRRQRSKTMTLMRTMGGQTHHSSELSSAGLYIQKAGVLLEKVPGLKT